MTEPTTPAPEIVTATVKSSDGTTIAYRHLGAGDPIVIVSGSLTTSEAWLPVAAHLAGRYSVYVLDRRGRGLSGDAESYTLATEAADIAAVVDRAVRDTGATPVLVGHSFGAICCLEAVRLGTEVASLVLYEPPLPVEGPVAGKYLDDYAALVAASDNDRAMRLAAKHFLRVSEAETEALAATPLWDQFLALAPTWTRELAAIDASVTKLPEYSALPVRTLLLAGEISPSHLLGATTHLDSTLPDATLVILPGQSHSANTVDPAGVARVLAGFIGG